MSLRVINLHDSATILHFKYEPVSASSAQSVPAGIVFKIFATIRQLGKRWTVSPVCSPFISKYVRLDRSVFRVSDGPLHLRW